MSRGTSASSLATVTTAVLLGILVPSVSSHGRLIEPPSRASAWRYGFNTPPNYNDHELYCGGFTRQWQRNEGRCGVCGDPWDVPLPRAHEYGGRYGQGVIVRKYPPQSVITIRIELTASHQGYFEFRVCPDYKNASQECLDKYPLTLVRSAEQGGQRFYPRDGNKIYEMRYRLPELACDHCLLQWKYVAGNNWGTCPNGTGMVGCGPQEEFRSCADISITSKAATPLIPTVPTARTTEVSVADTTVATETEQPPTEEFTYTPLVSLVVCLLALLATLLSLFFLYIYYYEVGRRVKSWLKGSPKEEEAKRQDSPVPPPRVKRRSLDFESSQVRLDLESSHA